MGKGAVKFLQLTSAQRKSMPQSALTFEFFIRKTRYCLAPLTSCQYVMGLSMKFCFITDCIALTSHGAVVFFLFLIISTDKLKGYPPLCRFLFLFFAHKVLNIIAKQ